MAVTNDKAAPMPPSSSSSISASSLGRSPGSLLGSGASTPAFVPATASAQAAEPAARTAARPPVQSEEEQELVKRYVLLGIVMRILDHDIRVVARSGMKLPRLYESMLRGVQDRVLLDLAALRRQFRDAGIKIYEELQQKDGMSAKYVCRGYHHHFSMVWGFVKAESERLMKTYLREP